MPAVEPVNLSPLRLGRWQGNNFTDNNFRGYIDHYSISVLDDSGDGSPVDEQTPELRPGDTEFRIQVGADEGQSIIIKFDELLIPEGSIRSQLAASASIIDIDAKLEGFNRAMASVGAIINRMESMADNLANINLNTSESRSRIVDADYAKVSSELAKKQIISQAATAMLAQANQMPQQVLSLLRF